MKEQAGEGRKKLHSRSAEVDKFVRGIKCINKEFGSIWDRVDADAYVRDLRGGGDETMTPDEQAERIERLEVFFEGVSDACYRFGKFTAEQYKELAELTQLDGPNKK